MMWICWLLLQDPFHPGTHDLALDQGERKRTFRLHVPASYAGEPGALVLVLHGALSTGAQTEALTGFDKLADDKGFAVVYPDGIDRIWRYSDKLNGGVDDFAFLIALIDYLRDRKLADPKRVYSTGISNGAYMSYMLAVKYSDRFAAIAPVAGSMIRIGLDGLKPSRAVPVLHFHGTQDPIVGYDGTDAISKGRWSLSAGDVVAWWAKKNQCEPEAKVEKLPDSKDDGTTVEKRVYEGKAPVVLIRIEGGGHTWPGGLPIPERVFGKTCRDVNASEMIWEFFSRFTLP